MKEREERIKSAMPIMLEVREYGQAIQKQAECMDYSRRGLRVRVEHSLRPQGDVFVIFQDGSSAQYALVWELTHQGMFDCGLRCLTDTNLAA